MCTCPPFLQGWSLPLRRSSVSLWPCLWSVWQELVWPSSSQRAFLHLRWQTSSLLCPSSSWWWDAKTHIWHVQERNRHLKVSFPLYVLGLWWFSRQSQRHAELALLGEMDQYLQIWIGCKTRKAREEDLCVRMRPLGLNVPLCEVRRLFSLISLSLFLRLYTLTSWKDCFCTATTQREWNNVATV